MYPDETIKPPASQLNREAIQSMTKLFELLIQIDQRKRQGNETELDRDKHSAD